MLRSAAMIAVVSILIASAFAPASARFGYCSEPTPPWCHSVASTFDDKSSFNLCRSQMTDYVGDVDDYVDCLRDEQKDAIAESNKVVDKFNCYAKGNRFCL
jgi:hypothetical protein